MLSGVGDTLVNVRLGSRQRQRETLATRQGTLHFRGTQTGPGTQGHMGSREEKEEKN